MNFALELKLPVSILREGKKFIAYSHALDLSTCGDSSLQAKKRFNEIVNIFFEEIIEAGTLEETLMNLGWRRVQDKWMPPLLVSQEAQTIKIMPKNPYGSFNPHQLEKV